MDNQAAVLKAITGETMALQGVTAKGTLNGLLFELAVEQRYRNPAETNIEAVYTFPLPSGAVLLDFEVKLGGKTLTGVVVEKRVAEAKYEEAIGQGDTAIMLERAGDGLCTVNLGNLMAGEEATIRYRYAQLLRFEHGSVRLTIPTVIAPRYGDPSAAGLQPHQQPVSDLQVAYPFALTIDVRGAIAAGRIASPSHRIATASTAQGVTVSLAQDAYLDRDFVLAIDQLASTSFATVARDGDGYVALASFCADVPHNQSEAPLRLKVVVDCSGSMNGDSMDAAKRALHRIFAGLTPADRFTLSRFGSTVHHDVAALTAATPEAIRAAADHLSAMAANLGGTEMEAALRSVFALGGTEAAADVLLITDGEIWNADSLVAAARAAGQRVFTVGIGASPTEGVLRRLADTTGGACEFVAPDEDAEAGILRMFARLRSPRVDRADVAWPGAPAWVTTAPRSLFGGETIHVFAGYAAAPTGDVAIRLVPAGEGEPLEARATLRAAVDSADTLARMAGAKRIESADAESRLALALQYQLLTDATNFIVVHERTEGEKAVDLPQLQQVAQMHAAGWGGVGSVRAVDVQMSDCMNPNVEIDCLEAHLQASRSTHSASRTKTTSGLDPAAVPALPPHHSSIREQRDAVAERERVARILDRQYGIFGGRRLPRSLADVKRLGVDGTLIDLLATFVGGDITEEMVVRAFLEAIEPGLKEAGASRQLLRALRNQFKTESDCKELRIAVAAIVSAPILAGMV
jgi:Ca-activated chloride channel family protein